MIAAAGASMLFAGTAQAHSGWYVGLNIGQAGLTDLDTTSSEAIAGTVRSLDLETDSDLSYGFKVGYNVVGHESRGENRFNVELYYQNSDHDIDGIEFQGNDQGIIGGDIEAEIILLRASFEIELGAIDPYFGIGIGEADLDIDGFYGYVSSSLADYARPIFVRLQEEIETTGTFKQRKVDLVKQGFDPSNIEDRLFFKDPKKGAYVALNAAIHKQIMDGEFRL